MRRLDFIRWRDDRGTAAQRWLAILQAAARLDAGSNAALQAVDLPHDFLIENENDLYETTDAWYLRTLDVPESWCASCVLVRFDGVYMDCDVLLNGHIVCTHHYGYTAFDVDLTSRLLVGRNTLAVHIRHQSPNSRMQQRITELGVRKAFGGTKSVLVRQILNENLMLTLLGGVVGLLFSYLAVYAMRMWLFTNNQNVGTSGEFSLNMEALFSPWVFLLAFVFCVVINLLSAALPAWIAARHTIVDSLNDK